LANTLRLVPHLHWIVVEDGNETVPYVGKILERSTLPFTYFAAQTPADHPDGNETVPYVGKILERSTLPFACFAAQTPADHP
ncbi:hypothetical protein OSTOST_13196, partial [Ostertagia ostertagi]